MKEIAFDIGITHDSAAVSGSDRCLVRAWPGRRVKRVRIAAGATQREMAKCLGVSQPTLAKIEGGRALRPDQAERIAVWRESRRSQLLADLESEIELISKL